ncbi:hypothetical protein CTKZ_03010 [Cellulomonas algicola]|uniref:Uncharacterized protein n=1 Tax=Cellulomonas algicola TaxID=2071633 RepID=A0A401UVM7_9CELL|nr:hypothetical protein CTKZ_03010 [Cellulomonas algicola]
MPTQAAASTAGQRGAWFPGSTAGGAALGVMPRRCRPGSHGASGTTPARALACAGPDPDPTTALPVPALRLKEEPRRAFEPFRTSSKGFRDSRALARWRRCERSHGLGDRQPIPACARRPPPRPPHKGVLS